MKIRPALPAAFAVLFLGGVAALAYQTPTAQGKHAQTALDPFSRPEPGTFPDQWIFGGDCVNDPAIQVHAYNQDLYILRQSKCTTYEAPFVYLIFGEDRVLLVDTGALQNPAMAVQVDRIIDDWLTAEGKTSIDLIVGHSHSHGDHIAGDAAFLAAPGVTHVQHGVASVAAFYGIASWPNDVGSIDLGGRVLDVLATPGHKDDSITFYDRKTHLLLTGDIVYPGHIFIFTPGEWPDYQASLARLEAWAADHPVAHVLGCHVEMSAVPGVAYPYGTKVQPNEHTLQLGPEILGKMRAAADAMGTDPQCQVFDEFVIHPVFKCGIAFN